MSLSNDLRAVQMIELEMLIELDRICRKYDIQYFLLAGTVLGAIRHKGFIPWDDDIDVGMMRDEYERFIRICPQELDSKYFLQTYKSDPNYPCLFAKLRKNGTTFIEKEVAKINMHHGIYIDIFPIDNIPNGDFSRLFHKCLLFLLEAIRISRTPALCLGSRAIVRVLATILHPFSRMVSKRLTDNIENFIATMYNGKHTECVGTIFAFGILEYTTRITVKRDYFSFPCKLKFEGYSFPVPGMWDEYLTHLYKDYLKLPPDEQRVPPHMMIVNTHKDYKEYMNIF